MVAAQIIQESMAIKSRKAAVHVTSNMAALASIDSLLNGTRAA